MKNYSFLIKPTRVTPYCKLDMRKMVLEFKGRSSPESSIKFYSPILRRLDRVFNTGSDTLTANFRFEYFNTSSSKCLFDLLKKLASQQNRGAEVTINWFYDQDDEDMRETGEDYEEILGMHFNYIPM